MIRQIAQKYVRFRMYMNRGMSYVADVKNLFYFALGFRLFGLSIKESAVLAAACGILVFLVGVADIHRFKIMQFEAKMMTNYNPVLRDIHRNTNRRAERNTDARHV